MTLKPQTVVIGLDGGIDTRTDPRQVKSPKLTAAQDVSHFTPGEVQKREATAAVTTPSYAGSSAFAGFNIGAYAQGAASSELVLHQQLAHINGDAAGVSHQPRIYGATGAAEYSPCFPARIRTLPLPQGGLSQVRPVFSVDTTSGLGLNTFMYTTTAGVYGAIVRLSDNANIASFTISGFAWTNFAACAIPGAGWVVAAVGTTGIGLYKISTTGAITVLNSALVANNAGPAVDITYSSANNSLQVVYGTSTFTLVRLRCTLAGAITTTTTIASNANSENYIFSSASNDTYTLVAYTQRASTLKTDISAVFINSVDTVSAVQSLNNDGLYYQLSAGFTSNGASSNWAVFATRTTNTALTSGNTNVTQLASTVGSLTSVAGISLSQTLSGVTVHFPVESYNAARQDMCMLTRPVLLSSVPVVFLVGMPYTQGTVYGFDYLGNIVARFADQSVSSNSYTTPPTNGQVTVGPCDTLNGVTYFAFAQRLTVTNDRAVLAQVTVPAVQPAMQQVGTQLHISGALSMVYDGAYVSEEGWHYKASTPVGYGTGPLNGGYLPAGTYSYIQTYEWTDGSGIVQQSEPTVGAPYTVNGTNQNPQLFFPYPTLTYKGNAVNKVNQVIWRTLVNGSIYYRLQTNAVPAAVSLTESGLGYVLQDSGSNADNTLISNAKLYTTDGSYVNQPPGAFTHTCQYRGRIIGVSAEDPTKVYFSSTWSAGSQLTWNRKNYIQVAPETGGATAVAVLDDSLVIFTRDRVFYTTGPGPAPTQAPTAGWNALTAVQSSVGCSVPSSVISLVHGVIFQSREGFMLLDRSQTFQYIGGAVESLTQLYNYARPYIYPERHYIVWEAIGAADGSTTTLAVDYGGMTTSQLGTMRTEFKWSVWTAPTGGALASTSPGVIYTQKTNGQLQQVLIPGTYLDSGTTAYPMIIETPWIPLGSMTGYGEVWEMQVLGEFKSAHTLQVQVGYDYGAYLATPLSISTATALTGGDTVYQLRFALPQPQCIAIRFKIQDTTQSGTGESCRISGLMLSLAVDDGLSRVASGKSG
jgi:hypothetical protein